MGPNNEGTRRDGIPQPQPADVRRLFRARPDVRLVLTRGKTAVTRGWQDRNPTAAEAVEWLEQDPNHMLGVVPASAGLVTVDCDECDPPNDGAPPDPSDLADLVGRAHQPLQTASRKPGRAHLWFRHPGDGAIRNRDWASGGVRGDIRGDAGYVILWDLRALVDRLEAAPLPIFPPVIFPPRARARGGEYRAGGRNNALNVDAFAAARRGDEAGIEAARRKALASGLPRAEVERTIASARDGAARAAAETDEYGRVKLATDDEYGLKEALKVVGFAIRYNERSARPQLREHGGEWRDVTDRKLASVRLEVARRCTIPGYGDNPRRPAHWGSDRWPLVYNGVLDRTAVDPLREWLEGLPQWDGRPRLEHLLTDMFGAELDGVTRWASAFAVRGVVNRTYAPGAKLDQMPVLIGKQGIGKSSFARELIPPEFQADWFSDALNFRGDPKQQIEALQGRAIVEASELAGMGFAELESLKAFISRQVDSIRLAYRRNPEPLPRRCVIIGTADREDCLPNDPAGLRRFVPVTLRHGCDVEAHLGEVRGQLWAEGVHWWKSTANPTAALPRRLIEAAAERAEAHRGRDEIWEEKVAELERQGDRGPLALQEIVAKVGACTAKDQARLSKALKNRGWEKDKRRWSPGEPPRWKWFKDSPRSSRSARSRCSY